MPHVAFLTHPPFLHIQQLSSDKGAACVAYVCWYVWSSLSLWATQQHGAVGRWARNPRNNKGAASYAEGHDSHTSTTLLQLH